MKDTTSVKRKRRHGLRKVGDTVGDISDRGWGVAENDNWFSWREAHEFGQWVGRRTTK